MTKDYIINIVEKAINYLLAFFTFIASTALVALIVITCVDVIGRYFFNSPLMGSTEMTEIGLALSVFSVLPIITYRQKHIVIDILDFIIPEKMKYIIVQTYLFLGVIGFYYLGEYSAKVGNRMFKRGTLTEYLEINQGYVVIFAQYVCYVTAILLAILIVKNFIKPENYLEGEGYGD